MGDKMRGNKETSIHKDPAFIKVYVPITHDEETGLDVWDVDFAYNEFGNAIKEFENDNDMRYDAWNDKQRDYMNDQR
tara:strand:- start:1589 stop:1819 length:231 start_codon:yes stop_codon:yes gene_type:complete